MICTCIQKKNYEEILSILSSGKVEMAELRLDLCPELTDAQISEIFADTDVPLVATCRGDARRLALAIEAGARFADLELEAPANDSRNIQKLCRKCGTELIRSYHNMACTPSDDELQRALARCFRYGADIVKIAVVASCEEDVRRVLGLYSVVLEGVESMEGRLVAFAMGNEASASRVECLRRGAPFTYACLDGEDTTAPGQLTVEEMTGLVYGNFTPYFREVRDLPASKSIAQRAIIAAALADGVSRISGYTPCGDSEAAIAVARTLGADVSVDGGTLIVTGIAYGARGKSLSSSDLLNLPAGRGRQAKAGSDCVSGTCSPLKKIDVGESGLLARLCIPLLSVLADGPFTVTGSGTLPARPLAGAVNIMAAFGVMLRGGNPGREIHVPVEVSGKIIPGTADVSGADGSQLISGLLMALPLCDKPSSLFVGEPKSIPYLYITQDVMRAFGVKISTEMEGDAEMLEQQDWSYCTGLDFRIPGHQTYKAADFHIEADWSAAAAYLVAGAIFGSVTVEGLDTHSLQADLSIIDILVDAGAVVSEVGAGQDASSDGEAVTQSVCVRKAPLEAFDTNLDNAPDLFPLVAVLAAFCAGQSTISGIGRLRTKESDRCSAILEMLSGMGVEASVEGDVMLVSGETLASRILRGHLLRGGKFSSHHDHRMVMALSVASLGAATPVEIDDFDCVAKSWPGFIRLRG